MEILESVGKVLEFAQAYHAWILAAGCVGLSCMIVWTCQKLRSMKKALLAICAGIEESEANEDVKKQIKTIARKMGMGAWLYTYIEKYINNEKYKKILKKILM